MDYKSAVAMQSADAFHKTGLELSIEVKKLCQNVL